MQVVGSTNYHLMSGPSVLDQTRECAVRLPPSLCIDRDPLAIILIVPCHFLRLLTVLRDRRCCRRPAAAARFQTAFNKTADPDPSHFAGNEFLDSTFSFGNGTIISLVHTEYPGNDYNQTGPDAPMCTVHPCATAPSNAPPLITPVRPRAR